MTSAQGPAVKLQDTAFLSFAADLVKLVRGNADPRDGVARRTAALLETGWRTKDERYRVPQPGAPYGSYLLFALPGGDLSVVLDIFLPGQVAAIHNHLTWGVFGCVEGMEIERSYAVDAGLSKPPVEIFSSVEGPGSVRTADPQRNSFHQVETTDVTSMSLHIYGADIGRIERDMWNADTGRFESFCSGYSNDVVGLPAYLALAGDRSLP